MSRDYWLTCDKCHYEWIGEPYRTDGTDECCPECGWDGFEVGQEWHTKLPSLYPLILLIPNFLLFVS